MRRPHGCCVHSYGINRRIQFTHCQQRKSPENKRLKDPDFRSSQWGMLIKRLSSTEGGIPITSRDGKLFRRHFRVPWEVYIDLVEKCVESKLFGENSNKTRDNWGNEICHPAIKLLGVLRILGEFKSLVYHLLVMIDNIRFYILGRNWSFDDVAEATRMGESTVRRSFLKFCENFVDKYYTNYVFRPEGIKLKKTMDVYSKMGLPGCIGSTDCVHVKWDRCPVQLHHLCNGKEGYPTLAYSVTVDHHRRILGVTRSNFGARNDKTIVRLDSYVMDVKNELIHADIEFDVFVNGVLVKMKGVYYLCDGGYHKWLCMMNPMKHTSVREQRLWSEWVESVRKDVECCFGILKSRFRFLRHGIVLQNDETIDFIFFTCCILHNIILELDGLDCRWETNVDWEALNPQPDNSDEGYDMEGMEGRSRHISQQVESIMERVAQWRPVDELVVEDNETVEEMHIGFEPKRQILITHFQEAYNRGLVHQKNKGIYNKGKELV